ncbi:tail fiber domain-containing protein [Salmonella enterica subsp. enterica serovar Montevideo]|nr:tail fiber domain-containing protein [Salmonella enterica]EIR7484498.1 tail fiber domain-containing protein [Salmonella enterica subsp. enterica serovar Montevideo]ELX3911805.1 tail fiber domain-containing protein [Salmonella enterica]HCL5269465.1 tail fiber domain-containing protein [Salmonella enterica]
MADIFNGKDVKVYYNDDTGNRAVITGGNIQINELAAYPSFSMGTEVQKIETYDDEYSNAIEGQKTVDNVTLVVNYIPTDPTHEYLDKKYDNQGEFQITIFVNEDNDAGRLESVMLNGVLGSRILNGDKDSVVTMTYDFVPTEVISYAPRNIPPVLRRGDFGVGSDGSIDFPQYQPDQATGNAFVKISASDIDNPSGVDLMGIELVDQQSENTNIMMTTTGDLRLYARNATTPWTRLYTSGEADTRYLIKSNNLSDLTNFESARSNLSVYSKSETDKKFMIGPNNLSELTNVVVARQKLEVYSQSETEAKFLQAANNLSDIVDTAIARTNLGINSTLENDAKYLQVENNLSDVKDVATARTNLGINSTLENDAKYLQVSNNLSDVADAAAARTNISVYSKAESDATYVPKTTTVNGHALDSNVTVSKADVGLGSVTDDPQLKISANLSDLSDVGSARTVLLVQGVQCNSNIESGAFNIFYSPNGANSLRLANDGSWRVANSNGESIPLNVENGGIGSTTAAGGRFNLELNKFGQRIGETIVYSPDEKSYITINNDNWGVYGIIDPSNNTSGWKPLLIGQGGTGATSDVGARDNLGLGNGSSPQFANLQLTRDEIGGGGWSSGTISFNSYANGLRKGYSTMYNEYQSDLFKTTISTGNDITGRVSYLQFAENGTLSGANEIYLNSNLISYGESLNLFNNTYDIQARLMTPVSPAGAYSWVGSTVYNYLSGQVRFGGLASGGDNGIDRARLYVARGGNSGIVGNIDFYPDYGGWASAGRGWYGNCIQGGWGLEDSHMGAPFWAQIVSSNDGGWSPIVTGGTSSTGGYTLRAAFGCISNGNNAWPETTIKLLGDGRFHRAFNFSTSGGIYTWGQDPWGGNYDFARNATSDRCLKHDIIYTNGKESFDRVMQWLPTMFKYNGQETQRYGLIAQDLQQIDEQYVKLVPGAPIFEDEEYVDEDGETKIRSKQVGEKDGTYALDINVLLTDMACSMKYMGVQMQEQETKIADQQKQIDELKELVQKILDNK